MHLNSARNEYIVCVRVRVVWRPHCVTGIHGAAKSRHTAHGPYTHTHTHQHIQTSAPK